MRRIARLIVTLFYKCKFISKCRIHAFSNIVLRNCSFAGKNALGEKTWISHSSMGYGSYMGMNCEFSNCRIGNYCSIGNYVRVVSASHPTDTVSMHPAFYSKHYYFSYNKKTDIVEHLTTSDGFDCKIGSDVWIGDNVLIKGGITIGDGAVIAMGSIVTHNVAPYTIVAGVPAKALRTRFDDSVINKLLEIKWWNKPQDWIKANAEVFGKPDDLIKLCGGD